MSFKKDCKIFSNMLREQRVQPLLFYDIWQMRHLIILFILFTSEVCAQDTTFARECIQTLCSKKFSGRGYIGNGCIKSSKYIVKEFKNAGLMPIANSYFQEFSFAVVVFPKDPYLNINGKTLIPGVDFIVGADAPSSSITTNPFIGNHVVWIDKDNILDTNWCQKLLGTQTLFYNTVLGKPVPEFTMVYVIDTLPIEIEKARHHFIQALQSKANTITMVKNKLTWSVGTEFSKVIHFEVLRSSVVRARGRKPDLIRWTVKTKMRNTHQQNVMGIIKGSEKPDSILLICAHYDHLGKMGKTSVFPGANDNAAGVAMVLDLANYYKKNPPKFTVVFVAFAGEEAGLIGSYYFVKHSPIDLNKTRFVLNLDLVGTGETGMTVVNATVFKNEFALVDSINRVNHYLPQIVKRGKASISDHYFFTEKGIPSFFWYQSGPRTSYHDVYDKPETLSLVGYLGTFELAVKLLAGLGN
jgi:aminopeptidase YwaD